MAAVSHHLSRQMPPSGIRQHLPVHSSWAPGAWQERNVAPPLTASLASVPMPLPFPMFLRTIPLPSSLTA